MIDHTCPINWTALDTLLTRSQSFVLTSHVRPDCDALGSELAMAAVLEALGKQVRIVNADSVPPRLAFVDPHQRIQVLGQDVAVAELDECDVIMVLDTSAWGQLGAMADVIRHSTKEIVVIDHHASEGELPALVLKDPQSEATGRLVYEAARHLGVSLTREMANALFVAIATDTGWFRFPSTSNATYRVAGDLVAAGACPAELYRQLYERDSISRVKLRGIVLSRLTTDMDGRLATTYVKAEDFQTTGALASETEDFVNMALTIDGTEVAVMFTHLPVGSVKVSFRSRSSVDCSRLAAAFGGGGHKAAAGATVQGSLEEVQRHVLAAVRNIMQEPTG